MSTEAEVRTEQAHCNQCWALNKRGSECTQCGNWVGESSKPPGTCRECMGRGREWDGHSTEPCIPCGGTGKAKIDDRTEVEKRFDLLIAERRKTGRATYGRGLSHDDPKYGDRWLLMALEEALDLSQYLMVQVVRQEGENKRYRETMEQVVEWYRRDGSVGGCYNMIEAVEACLAGPQKPKMVDGVPLTATESAVLDAITNNPGVNMGWMRDNPDSPVKHIHIQEISNAVWALKERGFIEDRGDEDIARWHCRKQIRGGFGG